MAQLGAGATVERQHDSGLGQVDGRRRPWRHASLVATQQIRLQQPGILVLVKAHGYAVVDTGKLKSLFIIIP
jgi:hypothetical protein